MRSSFEITYESFDVEEEYVTLRILWIASEALNHQRCTFGFYLIAVFASVATVQLLELVETTLSRVTNCRQVSMTQTPEQRTEKIKIKMKN